MTNLVLALLETERPLSLREIGAAVAGYPPQHGALRQAFERDKKTLRDLGIPIATERIDGEDQAGYRIDPDEYYLPELDLSEDERRALGFALAAVRLEGGVIGDVASKLGAAGGDSLPPIAVLPSLPFLGVLEQAIRQRSSVSFTYRGRTRLVDGYGLVFKEGSWYFVGADASAGAGELRTFRVDRFESAPELGDPDGYELPVGFDVATEVRFSPFDRSDAPATTEVVVSVRGRSVRQVLTMVGLQAVVARNDDGSVELAFPVADEAAFCSYVVGLGDDALVRSPEHLRDQVIETLRAIAGSGS